MRDLSDEEYAGIPKEAKMLYVKEAPKREKPEKEVERDASIES